MRFRLLLWTCLPLKPNGAAPLQGLLLHRCVRALTLTAAARGVSSQSTVAFVRSNAIWFDETGQVLRRSIGGPHDTSAIRCQCLE